MLHLSGTGGHENPQLVRLDNAACRAESRGAPLHPLTSGAGPGALANSVPCSRRTGGWLPSQTPMASGRTEAFVQPYPALGNQRPVSVQGADSPLSTQGGREQIYREPVGADASRVIAVNVSTDGSVCRRRLADTVPATDDAVRNCDAGDRLRCHAGRPAISQPCRRGQDAAPANASPNDFQLVRGGSVEEQITSLGPATRFEPHMT